MTLLSEELKETFMKSKNQEIHFKVKLREKLVKTIQITGAKLSEEEIQHKVDTNQIDELCSKGILGETEEAKQKLDEINKRHDQIKGLEGDIQELTELFSELCEYVSLQGVAVDDIEKKVETAREDVRRAVDLLGQARSYLDKARTKKKLLAIIAGAVTLLLLIIIIASSVPSADQPTSLSPAESAVEISITTTTTPGPGCDEATDYFCIGG